MAVVFGVGEGVSEVEFDEFDVGERMNLLLVKNELVMDTKRVSEQNIENEVFGYYRGN